MSGAGQAASGRGQCSVRRGLIDQRDHDAGDNPLDKVREGLPQCQPQADVQGDVIVEHERAKGKHPDQRPELCATDFIDSGVR